MRTTTELLERLEGLRGLDEARGKKYPVSAAFYKYFEGIQVPLMQIAAIYRDIKAAIESGKDLDEVMPPLVKKWRAQ